jgi:hypothetical protein
MKQVIFFLLLLVSTAASATPIKVDEKIQKQFAKAFPTAQRPTWYSDETHYEVVFYQGDVQCRIVYRLNGAVERTERYYTERDLAPFVLAKVKGKYPDYRVHGVTEFTTELGVVYHLILEGEQRWLHVRTDDTGSSTVVKRIKKQVVPAGVAQRN